MNRLSIAMLCYAVLAVLVWSTIKEPKLRMGTFLILGLFALKSILRRNDVLHPDEPGESEAAKGLAED